MIDTNFVRTLVNSFPGVTEEPHFEKISFRYKRKIFATVATQDGRLVVKLSTVDQSVFIDYNDKIFSAATGAWGKQGWTIVEMKRVRKDMAKDLLMLAYKIIAK